MNEEKLTSKEKFLKIYANLPLNIRDEIVCVLPEKGTISWNVAYLEIKNDSGFATEILKKLVDLKLL